MYLFTYMYTVATLQHSVLDNTDIMKIIFLYTVTSKARREKFAEQQWEGKVWSKYYITPEYVMMDSTWRVQKLT